MATPFRVGAVLGKPTVSVIWDIIDEFFDESGCPMDVVYFRTYDQQAEALAKGDIDIAWHSPLAWVDSLRRMNGQCRVIAMRDTDRDRETHFVVADASGIDTLDDLRGKKIGLGPIDSPHATMIPLDFLHEHDLEPGRDFEMVHFATRTGEHGDQIQGELEAFRALQRGEVDAIAIFDLNWQRWTANGSVNPQGFRRLATTGRYDHCVFAARLDLPADELERWCGVLLSMTYDNPKHREMMDLEGLTQWLPGRETGFDLLKQAAERQRTFERVTS